MTPLREKEEDRAWDKALRNSHIQLLIRGRGAYKRLTNSLQEVGGRRQPRDVTSQNEREGIFRKGIAKRQKLQERAN